MSNWVSISAADLNATKVAALVDALRTAALAIGQSDPVDELLGGVAARIRAEIKGCQRNQVDQDTTKIPADLKGLACRMVIREAQSRLQLELTEDERTEQKNDLDYLRRISKCEVPVATPDNPIPGETQAAGGFEIASSNARQLTRRTMGGL